MLSTTPAIPPAPLTARSALGLPAAERHVLSETELAHRWGVHPKTLQRWRCEGRGPKYFKVSKHISYPLEEVTAFEHASLRASTSERAHA